MKRSVPSTSASTSVSREGVICLYPGARALAGYQWARAVARRPNVLGRGPDAVEISAIQEGIKDLKSKKIGLPLSPFFG